MRTQRSTFTLVRDWVAVGFLWSVTAGAAPIPVDFASERWEFKDGEVVDHLGRKSLTGVAIVKDVEFDDGVIEVDVAVDGRRSYPGVIFRVQSDDEYERLYLRPHRAGLYPDAIQYTPVFNGDAGWQLYHGDGFTASVTVPENAWFHMKVEVRGTQARVFVNGNADPALNIHDLKHGLSKGSIGLMGPKDGTAYFSNFRYEPTSVPGLVDPPKPVTSPGTLNRWEISKSFPSGQIDRTSYPDFFQIFQAGWRPVEAEASGLVDVSRYIKRSGAEPECVLARTIVRSDKPQDVKLSLGYSDDVTVFLNGRPLFSGVSGYRSRDPSYVGVIGLFDTVYLPLQKGLNEILLMVTDSFGGWGFMGRTAPPLEAPLKRHDLATKVWETPADFMVPESVLFDRQRKVLYVSNFNRVAPTPPGQGFLSKVTMDGRIEQLRWITDLDGPCGMGLNQDRLFVVEASGNLVEIDIDGGRIVQRYKMPGSTFLNDLTVDPSGTIYISNTSRIQGARDIYEFKDGSGTVFKTGDELHRTNGLLYHDQHLLAGNTGDGLLKLVHLGNGLVRTVTSLGAGVIDGIKVDNEGRYLVSHWEGQVYRISPSGDVVELLDTMDQGRNCADFEFVGDDNLLVIPTFLGNSVMAYRLSSE